VGERKSKPEGSQPPELYHYYTGHDNNRDWYAFTQPETRYTVDSLYTPWNPQIVNDIHQQGSNAGRIFIPPYMDPVEPNIDPVLTAGTSRDAGVLRDPSALADRAARLAGAAAASVGAVPGPAAWETTNLHTVASVLVAAALLREESRGCHRRSDVTGPDDAWRRPVVAALDPTLSAVRLEARP